MTSTAAKQPHAAPADAENGARALLEALAAAGRDCAREIGLPVALEDEAVHALLKAAGYSLSTAGRKRLGVAVGLHTFPLGKWSYHAPELRMFCTAPIDPRPQAAWDECLWLEPHTLLTRTPGKESRR